jgi:hypothetical protein
MTGKLRVDPDQIQYSAAGIRDTAQNLAGSVQDFHGQVQGLVQQPGGDMISPLIWSAHSAVLSAALRCFASNTSALYGHAAKLDATAADYRTAEHDNVTAIAKVGKSL